MKSRHHVIVITALLCLAFSGCGPSSIHSTEPAEPASVSSDVDSQPAAGDSAADFADRAPETDMVPVRSDELNGIWLGAADNVAVVIRFIGRESRQPNRRGTVEGEWTVHVPGHTIGSGLQFLDDETTGVVELEVGLWNTETGMSWRASLGRVERGVSDRLYLSIYENKAHAAYPAVARISLKHISDHPKIQQEDVDQMLVAASHSP